MQVVDGEIRVAGLTLKRGDGLALDDEAAGEIVSGSSAELLYFDLPG